jgi:hypothetical protein
VREVIDQMLALRPVSGIQRGWTVVEEEWCYSEDI